MRITMKKLISMVCLALLVALTASAQEKSEKKGANWQDKVRAERVAFLTTELDLSEAEAQDFWPVYNAVQKERRDAFKAVHSAAKALSNALKKGEGDTAALLEAYLKAHEQTTALERSSVERFKKVLPIEKVAKLSLAEEKFRHRQIGQLQPGRPQGNRPGQNRQPGRGLRHTNQD